MDPMHFKHLTKPPHTPTIREESLDPDITRSQFSLSTDPPTYLLISPKPNRTETERALDLNLYRVLIHTLHTIIHTNHREKESQSLSHPMRYLV